MSPKMSPITPPPRLERTLPQPRAYEVVFAILLPGGDPPALPFPKIVFILALTFRGKGEATAFSVIVSHERCTRFICCMGIDR
jgi:hypothetical protein